MAKQKHRLLCYKTKFYKSQFCLSSHIRKQGATCRLFHRKKTVQSFMHMSENTKNAHFLEIQLVEDTL